MTEWTIIRVPEGYNPKEFFNEKCGEHDWSDKFRGIEWKKEPNPPKEWLIKEIADLKSRADQYNKLAQEYIEMVNSGSLDNKV